MMKNLVIIFLLVSSIAMGQTRDEFGLQLQTSHHVTSVAISPDNQFFVSGGSQDGVVKVWETATGRLIKEFHGHLETNPKTRSIEYCFVLKDNETIISASDKDILSWNVNTLETNSLFRHPISGFDFDDVLLSSQENYLAVRSQTHFIKVLNPNDLSETVFEIPKPGQYFSFWDVTFSPDGNYIYCYETLTKSFFGFELQSQNRIVKLSAKKLGLTGDLPKMKFNGFSDGGKTLKYNGHSTIDLSEYTSFTDAEAIELADAKTSLIKQANRLGKMIGSSGYYPEAAIAVSDDLKYLVSRDSEKKELFIIDLERMQFIRKIAGESNALEEINTDAQGRYFVVNGENGALRVWDMHLGRVFRNFYQPGLSEADISEDGKQVLSMFSVTTNVGRNSVNLQTTTSGTLYDVASGRKQKTSPVLHPMFYQSDQRYVGINSKKMVVAANIDGSDPNDLIEHSITENTIVTGTKYDGKPFKLKDMQGTVLKVMWNVQISPSGNVVIGNAGLEKRDKKGKKVYFGGGPTGIYIYREDQTIINFGATVGDGIDRSKITKYVFTKDESFAYAVTSSYQGNSQLYKINTRTGQVESKFIAQSANGRSLALSEDETRVYIAGNQGIEVFDLSNGKTIKLIDGHDAEVMDVMFTPDYKRFITSSRDQTIKLWNVATDEVIATFIPAGIKDFAVVTPDGYYSASKSVGDYLHFVKGMKTYDFANFDLMLNRPDIVLERLGYVSDQQIQAYKGAYLKRLKKMGFTEDQIGSDRHLPELTINTKGLPLETEEKVISLEVTGSDGKYLLDRFNVYVNGVPIYGSKGKSVRSKGSSNVTEVISIPLSSGDNQIQISVHNEKGIESIRKSVTIFNTNKVTGSTYVVSIGISDYQNDEFDLNYAAKDANDISAKFGTDASKVFSITDGDAVKEKILAIKSELMKSKVDDRVILFVAGHGLLDDNLDYYIGMHDVDFENPASRGLPYEDLEGLLDGIPARKKLMLIDACHSGEVDKDDSELIASNAVPEGTISARGFKTVASKSNSLGLANSFQLMQELFADLRKGTGAVVISSASGAEFALESDAWKNGVFTYSILEGLENRKCDANKDGAVQVSELKDYVFDRVAELTNGKQHPTSRRENLEHDFVVW